MILNFNGGVFFISNDDVFFECVLCDVVYVVRVRFFREFRRFFRSRVLKKYILIIFD